MGVCTRISPRDRGLYLHIFCKDLNDFSGVKKSADFKNAILTRIILRILCVSAIFLSEGHIFLLVIGYGLVLFLLLITDQYFSLDMFSIDFWHQI